MAAAAPPLMKVTMLLLLMPKSRLSCFIPSQKSAAFGPAMAAATPPHMKVDTGLRAWIQRSVARCPPWAAAAGSKSV